MSILLFLRCSESEGVNLLKGSKNHRVPPTACFSGGWRNKSKIPVRVNSHRNLQSHFTNRLCNFKGRPLNRFRFVFFKS